MEVAGPLGTPLGLAQRKRASPRGEDGGVSGVSSSCGARGGFLPRHDEDLREPLVRRQGSQVSMRTSLESVMPSSHLILCRPLLLPPSTFLSIRVFSNELVLCIRWPKYWSFSFSISPSNEYSVLISFRIDWLDLLVV